MVTTYELKQHLVQALEEVGEIQPWWDEETDCWIFSHPAYPVEYPGDTPEAVIKGYPLWLMEFLEERLKGNLAPFVEAETTGLAGSGRGGARPGAGRPKGTTGEPTLAVRLPQDVALWLKHNPGHIEQVRAMMREAS